ncbi:hypothetical protein HU200_020824 [Digitaria exilis]|uniref:Bowman-Birk serine protease inhibitors family domain-containing protein n=1 Tax=Digitaria exilis TaxID=1010633 RepID=A0A835KC60_9POAL|nr:hypothetical protein HU200_020824 [Digitaria exilis]CAB3472381.1 unnamed protein product [Digitaria exilis]
MASGVASSIPLRMLWLEAALLLVVVAAGASTAAVDVVVPDGMDAIRLPTDVRGVADVVAAMARATDDASDEERPWKCCDLAVCTRSQPPICRCLDKVTRCSSACKQCDKTSDTMSRTCTDWYKGQPGPRCDHDAGSSSLAAAAAGTTMMAGGDENEKRPWKCCSLPICTRSQPPVCHCWDVVKRCSRACERCEQVAEGSSSSGTRRYRCLDTHRGDPGPRCEEKWAPTVARRR